MALPADIDDVVGRLKVLARYKAQCEQDDDCRPKPIEDGWTGSAVFTYQGRRT